MLTSAIVTIGQCLCNGRGEVCEVLEMAVPATSIELYRVLQLSLLLFLAIACQSYEVVEVVEGTLSAEESKQYTIDVTGVLVGEYVTFSFYHAAISLYQLH